MKRSRSKKLGYGSTAKLGPHELTLVEIPGDGHCLYSAIIAALSSDALDCVQAECAQGLRNRVANVLEKRGVVDMKQVYENCVNGVYDYEDARSGRGKRKKESGIDPTFMDPEIGAAAKLMEYDAWIDVYLDGVRGESYATDSEICVLKHILKQDNTVLYVRTNADERFVFEDTTNLISLMWDGRGSGDKNEIKRLLVLQLDDVHYDAWVSETPVYLTVADIVNHRLDILRGQKQNEGAEAVPGRARARAASRKK